MPHFQTIAINQTILDENNEKDLSKRFMFIVFFFPIHNQHLLVPHTSSIQTIDKCVVHVFASHCFAQRRNERKKIWTNKSHLTMDLYLCDGTFLEINLAWNRFGLLFRNHMKRYKDKMTLECVYFLLVIFQVFFFHLKIYLIYRSIGALSELLYIWLSRIKWRLIMEKTKKRKTIEARSCRDLLNEI